MISNNIKKIKAAITAVGGYTPDDFISNKDLEKMVDTNDEWITARTGIKKRRILKEKGIRPHSFFLCCKVQRMGKH